MIIRLPGCYPVVIIHSTGHWHPNGTHHGPQSNPTLVHVDVVKLGEPHHVPDPTFEGWRLWAYFRHGYAWCVDLHIDKRPVKRVRHKAKTLFTIGQFSVVRRS